MALWGNKDNIGAGGTVSLAYGTGVVTGTGTTFGQVGAAATGDVIRFGDKTKAGGSFYFGDAVIVSIASTVQLTIGSTAGLNSSVPKTGVGATSFQVSQLPKYTIKDHTWSETRTDADSYVYGVSEAGSENAIATQYETGVGWVGVTTYMGNDGELRVKKEILVAMSGISTGNTPIYDKDPSVN